MERLLSIHALFHIHTWKFLSKNLLLHLLFLRQTYFQKGSNTKWRLILINKNFAATFRWMVIGLKKGTKDSVRQTLHQANKGHAGLCVCVCKWEGVPLTNLAFIDFNVHTSVTGGDTKPTVKVGMRSFHPGTSVQLIGGSLTYRQTIAPT